MTIPKVRRMTFLDVDGVYEVESQTFSTPWSRASFVAEVTDNDLACYLVLEDQGTIAGFAGMWIVVDEAHVTNIALLPAYRGKGLGEKLVTALLETARRRHAVSMTLEVRTSNEIAQSLYRKLGFLPTGIRRAYYVDNHEDAIIMTCDLLEEKK